MGKGDILDYLRKSKHIWIIPAYAVFYMISFMLVEKISTETHLIHSFVDDLIPFCEYFIIPYVLWFLVVLGSVMYFALGSPSKKEYYQYMATLGVGMTLFLVISFVYPNGQNLRPELTGEGPFIQAVQLLYQTDTPTNIFPSIHVFNAVACCVAFLNNKKCRQNKLFTAGNIVLTVSIVLSTMFLKQHSVEDVVTALILNVICYQVFYRIIPENMQKFEQMLTRKELCTVPNLLNAGRLVLALVFMAMIERYRLIGEKSLLAVLLLAIIAADILAGRLVRKPGQISEAGRLPELLADRVCQFVILSCLIPKYSLAKMLLVLFFIKESYTVVLGWRVILYANKEAQAPWYETLNKTVFYIVALILFAGTGIPASTAGILIGACGICMMTAFVINIEEIRAAEEKFRHSLGEKVPERIG
ncbi:phosphatase PAP2 family protein [Blautia sp. XA-2221]|uniref:phosphatase PAP2 family protein n=1 Tax=Blautia sp. XA-2221 TaxID=2903961 RepID=UPI00237895EE|nr:phosphatase PAP2 family protein [Blautia sp. XA-2221]